MTTSATKLVPICPTSAMMDAGATHIMNGDCYEDCHGPDRMMEARGRAAAVWHEMISAAPACEAKETPQRIGKCIYLSGPMSGLPDLNFPAFDAEASRLSDLGYDVVNPANINPDPSTPWHECMRNDLTALLSCDTIAMLPGWENSNGAHLEMHVAHRVGIKVVFAREIVA